MSCEKKDPPFWIHFIYISSRQSVSVRERFPKLRKKTRQIVVGKVVGAVAELLLCSPPMPCRGLWQKKKSVLDDEDFLKQILNFNFTWDVCDQKSSPCLLASRKDREIVGWKHRVKISKQLKLPTGVSKLWYSKC